MARTSLHSFVKVAELNLNLPKFDRLLYLFLRQVCWHFILAFLERNSQYFCIFCLQLFHRKM